MSRLFRVLLAIVLLAGLVSFDLGFNAGTSHASITQLNGVYKVALGNGHTCALIMGGRVKCWGQNNTGQLGDGTNTQRLMPVDVVGLSSGVVDIEAGGWHTCAQMQTGNLKCWGRNAEGQLGNGTTTPSNLPVDVTGITGNVEQLGLGSFYSCVRMTDGTVKCWGDNLHGQLGNGNTTRSLTPLTSKITGVKLLSVGDQSVCAILLTNSAVWCWGVNDLGELGDGSAATSTQSLAPVRVVGTGIEGTGLSDGRMYYIAPSHSHVCGLYYRMHNVKCWGRNSFGQMGDGTRNHARSPIALPFSANTIGGFATGNDTTCANVGGKWQCWGEGDFGQLGSGSQPGISSNPVDVVGVGEEIVNLRSGGNHFCGITITTNRVVCWGYNYYGQLGINSTTNSNKPVFVLVDPPPIKILPTVTRVGNFPQRASVWGLSAGDGFTCGLASDIKARDLYCVGLNDYAQAGTGIVSVGPIGLSLTAPYGEMVSAGVRKACEVNIAGALYCWGTNEFGQLGTNSPLLEPARLPQLVIPKGVMAIAVGNKSQHGCAIVNFTQVKCWGRNNVGQVGSGITSSAVVSPVLVSLSGSDALKEVVVGDSHSCVLKIAGTIWCWGDNTFGQLGTGDTTQRTAPAQVVDITSAVSISSGSNHTCALLATGAVRCWGQGGNGALGRGAEGNQLRPIQPNGMDAGVVTISSGGTVNCAIMTTGYAKCFGDNTKGLLGIGTKLQPNPVVPVIPSGLGNTVGYVSVGLNHVCVLTLTGVMCWGQNSNGELNTGDKLEKLTPTAFVQGSAIIAATGFHDFDGNGLQDSSEY